MCEEFRQVFCPWNFKYHLKTIASYRPVIKNVFDYEENFNNEKKQFMAKKKKYTEEVIKKLKKNDP